MYLFALICLYGFTYQLSQEKLNKMSQVWKWEEIMKSRFNIAPFFDVCGTFHHIA